MAAAVVSAEVRVVVAHMAAASAAALMEEALAAVAHTVAVVDVNPEFFATPQHQHTLLLREANRATQQKHQRPAT